MRLYTIALIFLLLTVVLPDLFFFLKLKKHKVNKWIQVLNLLPTVFFVGAFLTLKFSGRSFNDPDMLHIFIWINFAFMVIYIPKLVYVIFHFLNYLLNLMLKEKIYLLRYAGALVAMFVVLLMAHGAMVNPMTVQLREVVLEIDELPEAFDGYRIVQISDTHLGSWGGNARYLKPAIDQVNKLDADILVFTGDIVNNYAEELDGWQEHFLQMRAKEGKYAIMGNHDYGDYSDWKDDAAKEANLLAIEQGIADFGFRLLLNEKVDLIRDSSVIELLGVENWGKPPFPKYGNLSETLEECDSSRLKILLSHDPSHWRAEVLEHEQIFLMLAGHTHAAQIAFNMYGKLRSPSSWVYDEWDGLYEEGKQFLFINRGLGFTGIPVRIGAARPEVTLIILKKKA